MTEGDQGHQWLSKKIEHYSFRLSDVVGKGYSSQVYKGTNDETQQLVAIKVIKMQMLKSQFNRQLLQSEIEILKLLRSYKSILSVHEIYTTKNNTYIISELCSGDMQQLIKRRGRLSESEALKHMCDILEAYSHIYELGIIHRDLKPANMLVDNQGNVKIADFGFAIKLEKLHHPCNYNVGSPLYMSPEALSNNIYSFKSDIWSIGIILFEMLNGSTPWQAKHQKDLLKKIQTEDISLKLDALSFSPVVNQFIRHCLTRDITKRMSPIELIRYKDCFSSSIKSSLQSKHFVASLKYIPLKKSSTENESTNTLANLASLKFKVKQSSHANLKSLRSNYSIAMTPKTSHSNDRSKDKSISKDKVDNRATNCRSKSNSAEVKQISSQKKLQLCVTPKGNQTVSPFSEQLSGKSSEMSVQEKKQVNKILLGEIHLCRFMFKLAVRIKKAVQNGNIVYFVDEVDGLLASYTRIIKTKLNGVKGLARDNFLNIVHHQQYLESKSYRNILRLCDDYEAKYSNELCLFWNMENSSYFTDNQGNDCAGYIQTATTLKMIKSMLTSLQGEIPSKFLFHEKFSSDIVIMDYLMTCKQLMNLAEGNNYQKFARKSRIQEIVEGFSTKITYQLYSKICTKAESMLDQC